MINKFGHNLDQVIADLPSAYVCATPPFHYFHHTKSSVSICSSRVDFPEVGKFFGGTYYLPQLISTEQPFFNQSQC